MTNKQKLPEYISIDIGAPSEASSDIASSELIPNNHKSKAAERSESMSGFRFGAERHSGAALALAVDKTD